jgi:hypothetical protein
MSTEVFHPLLNTTPEQLQEAAENLGKPPLETMSELTLLDIGDGIPYSGDSVNSLLSSHNSEDAQQDRLQSQVESNQPLAKEKKKMKSSPTSASADPVDSKSDVAQLWGRGYTLAPAGCELNRVTNNAQRREEISSNISLQYVITGKRSRTSKVNRT